MPFQMLRVIRDDPKDRCIILDTALGVFKIDRLGQMWAAENRLVFRSELLLAYNFYVYDARQGANPMDGIYAKILIAASPNKQHYRQLRKEPTFLRLFMPPWGLDELQLCRELCYPDVPAAAVTHMYSKVGGVPRSVFANGPRQQAETISELCHAVDGMSFRRCDPCAFCP